MGRKKVFGWALAWVLAQPGVVLAETVPAAPAAREAAFATGGIDTLEGALAEIYRSNPALLAARAELRAVDESYAQAKAGFRPSLSGGADYTHEVLDSKSADVHEDSKTIALTLSQSLYSGGSTREDLRVAESDIMAQRARLKGAEQEAFLRGAIAYLDVLRDQEILRLNAANEEILEKQLAASRERFRLGEITQTDVNQSEARLAGARGARAAAEGRLKSSRARFEGVVGVPPAPVLQPVKAGVAVPASVETAVEWARAENPEILSARHARAAAAALTRSIIGEGRPQVGLMGQLGRTYDPVTSIDDYYNFRAVVLRATVPFYTGGRRDSRVRQSRELEQQRRQEEGRAERLARESVMTAFADLDAARAGAEARAAQVEAARRARDGVRAEADYGARSTLDVLDAEQEYLDAQVGWISAERDRVAAAYALLAASGSLTAEKLGVGVEPYDPLKHFDEIKDKWAGYRSGTD